MAGPRKQPPQASPILPDPMIVHGSYKALPRTSGGFCILDTRKPFGHQLVRYCTTEGAARNAVTELGNLEWLQAQR